MSDETVLSPELNRVFEAVEHEVVWLHGRWIIFRQLFITDEDRIQVLMKTASSLFRIIHYVLVDDVILAICRLTDPAKTMGNYNNCSMPQIVELLRSTNPRLGDALDERYIELNAAADVFRSHRNKRIAHTDLDTVLSQNHLSDLTVDQIEAVLEMIRGFMNEFRESLGTGYMAYEWFWMNSDGDALISALSQYWQYVDSDTAAWDEWSKRKRVS